MLIDHAAALSLLAVIGYLLVILPRVGYRSLAFVFLGLQSTFYLPIFFLADLSDPYQFHFMVIHLVFFLALTLATLAFHRPARVRALAPTARRADTRNTHAFNLAIHVGMGE